MTPEQRRRELANKIKEALWAKADDRRAKDTIGALPVRALDGVSVVAADTAMAHYGERLPGQEGINVPELVKAGERLAAAISKIRRNYKIEGELRQEAISALRGWDRASDIDEDDDDVEEDVDVNPLTAHPHLRTKDWEQIWGVLTGGRIHDYDGFRGVEVEQTMTVEEFRDRLMVCTIQFGGGLNNPRLGQ